MHQVPCCLEERANETQMEVTSKTPCGWRRACAMHLAALTDAQGSDRTHCLTHAQSDARMLASEAQCTLWSCGSMGKRGEP